MKEYFKKLIALVSILSVLSVSTYAVTPKPAHAIFGLGDTVTDFFNGVINTLQAVWSGVQTGLQSALGVKTFTLDKIATAVAKQILMQLTLSVVNWINSGFQGGPAFVTNPSQYFQNLGDRIAGNFLQADGDLRFLCSPFNIDVRLALAVKMKGGNQNPYTCTLSGAIKNATAAGKNASINAFIQGDFSQGGWPAFMALTTEPQNNAGGAFLKAEDDLTTRINAKVNQKTNELFQGAGFLSSEKCDYKDGGGNTITKTQYDKAVSDPTASQGSPSASDVDNPSQQVSVSKENCTTVTPGSTISGVLQKSLNVPTDELELANDINAVINAAFSQLVLQVFKLGLSAINGSGSGAGSDYLASIQGEAAASFKAIQASTLQQLAPYITASTQVASTTDASLALIVRVHQTYQGAIDCYTNDIKAVASSSNPNGYAAGVAYSQSQISQLNTIIAVNVAPIETKLQTEDTTVRTSLQAMLNVQTSITNAQSPADLTDASTQLQNVSQNGSLPSAGNVQVAVNEYNDTVASTTPLQADANNRLAYCQAYNIFTGI